MKIVFATNNLNKIAELQALLPQEIKLMSLTEINCKEEIPETSNTILGNAIQKANYITSNYGYDCFADDTGLEIEALNNEPGVYSARYAGEQKNDNDNIDKVLTKLNNIENRNAQFITTIALNLNNKQLIFNGVCKGLITKKRSGKNGFGYDPIFKPLESNTTFAEMDMKSKNKISHRGKATQQLISYIKNLKKS